MASEHDVGLLGVGRIGEAIARALLRAGTCRRLMVTPRTRSRAEALAREAAEVEIAEADVIVDACPVVIVALLAEDARTVLPGLSFSGNHHVISALAGMRLDEFARITGGEASTCRAIFLPTIASRNQIIPVYPAMPVMADLFGAAGDVLASDSEDQLNAYYAATGVLASLLTFGEVGADWLVGQGIERAGSEAFVAALYAEVLALAEERGGFAQGRQEVMTPGGLNVTMRDRLQGAGLSTNLNAGLDALMERLSNPTGGRR